MQTKTTFKLLGASLISIMLAACGGADSAAGGTNGSGSGTPSVRIGSGTAASFISGKLTVDSSADSLFEDQSTLITADLVDIEGKAADNNYYVTFSSPCINSNKSSITGGKIILSVGGKVSAEYKAGTCSGDDTITATIGTNNFATVTIKHINNMRIGTGTDVNFVPGKLTLDANADSLFSNQTTLISADLVDKKGASISIPTTVTLTSRCIAAGTSSINGGNTVTSLNGKLSAEYKAGTLCTGDDAITATLSNSNSATATILHINDIRIGTGTAANFIPSKLTLDANADSLFSNQTVLITADIVDKKGAPITISAAVTLSSPCITSGASTITGGNTVTSINGKLSAEYKAGSCFGDDTITAAISGNSATATIFKINNKRIGTGLAAAFVPSKITVSTAANTLFEGDETQLSISIVNNKNEAVEQATEVTFSSTCLTVGTSSIVGGKNTVTSVNGLAQLTYKVGKCTENDPITASINNGDTITEAGTLLAIDTRRMGAGFGVDFINNALEIGVGTSTLSPGGTTAITAYLVNSKQDLITTPLDVTFSSPCLSSGNAVIAGGNKVTSVNGKAIASYTSNGCSGVDGVDIIKATAPFGTSVLTATADLKVKKDSAQSISFVSATPQLISIKGTGGTEISTLRFKVSGQAGTPVKGECVTFAPSTTLGGLGLVPSKCDPLGNETFGAKTDANGEVVTIVQAGTVTTPIRVTATTSNNISTQSSQLVVTTGIPDQNSTSISLSDENPVAWHHDGVESQVSIRLADAFNNPVPDGTAATFTASGGAIVSSCTTLNGTCSVAWRSQNPKPTSSDQVKFDNTTFKMSCTSGAAECRSGRVAILASAIGNESFIDGNGNGLYDDITKDIFINSNGIYSELTKNMAIANTPSCSPPTPLSSAAAGITYSCDDLREAYVDKNFNKTRDFIEEFIDFNQNSSFDALANGKYDGALCSGDAKNKGYCTSNKVTVRDDITLVMSSEHPFTQPSGLLPGQPSTAFPLLAGSSISSIMLLADENGNGMPAGTTVTIDTAGLVNATATVSPKGALASSHDPSYITVSFVADKDPLKTPSGSVLINITAPTLGGSLTTTFGISVK